MPRTINPTRIFMLKNNKERKSTVKNEHGINNNQRSMEGTSASNVNSTESQKRQETAKREEKEKAKRRQASHSAGAGKNR